MDKLEQLITTIKLLNHQKRINNSVVKWETNNYFYCIGGVKRKTWDVTVYDKKQSAFIFHSFPSTDKRKHDVLHQILQIYKRDED